MAKIYDYMSFSESKGGGIPNAYNFEVSFKYTEIDIVFQPEEYEDISDSRIHMDYSVSIMTKKSGIDQLLFYVTALEFEFEVDDYPHGVKEFDVDLIPGKTIDYSQIKIEENERLIPTYPDKIQIDMKKSTDPKTWQITVYFGSNYPR